MNKIFSNKIVLSLTHKLSFVFVAFYIISFSIDYSVKEQLIYLTLTVFIVFGIGGIGYLINDYTDLKQDMVANKRNIFLLLNKKQIRIIAIFCIITAIFPWLIFPFTKTSLLFLTAEICLFILYSCQPFRFKEKGWLGLLSDAFYAHLIPMAFAIYTYTLVKQDHFIFETFHLTGIIWIFLVGFRNILKHQIEDFNFDKISTTNTLIQSINIAKIKRFTVTALIPLEILFFLLSLILADDLYLNVFMLFVIYSGLYFFKRKHELIKEQKVQLTGLFNFLNERILNEFYERWLGLIILLLALLVSGNSSFLVILFFHLLLFHRILLAR